MAEGLLRPLPHVTLQRQDNGTPPLRILLAEDDPINQKLVTRILQKAGHSVVVAANGHEALRALGAGPINLVLMDVQMPVMDGYAATSAIRAPSSPVPDHDVHIIALTAGTSAADRERCLAAGVNDYICKPITTAALLAALSRAVQSGSPADAAPPAHAAVPPAPPPVQGNHTPPGAASGQTAAPPIDLAAASAAFGGHEFLAQVLTQFLTDAETQLTALRAALTALQRETLQHIAHRLKGAGASLEAAPLAQSAARLEAASATAEPAELQSLVQRVAEEIQRLGDVARINVAAREDTPRA